MDSDSKEFDWFDRPGSRKLLWRLLWGACAVSVLAELVFVFGDHRHGHFGIDGWFGFYAALGFVGCAVLILVAKGVGFALKRPETYYGDQDEETLPEDIDESA